MATNSLPSKDSPDLHLVVATPEEILAQLHANSVEWGGALSLEAYLRREEHLGNQNLTKNGALTSWMLVHQPSDWSQRQVLCGCESILKKSLVLKGKTVEEATAHGICSVFCPEKHRGRGYAGRMMAELGQRLKNWQTTNGKGNAFSVLFSDIGKDFYAARGWHPFPSAHISLPATSTTSAKLPTVHYLESQDLASLCERDEQLMHHRLGSKKHAGPAVALVPDIATLEWHRARENFVSKELYGRSPTVCGAMVGDTEGQRVWCYWTCIWTNPQEDSPNTMHILRLVVEEETDDNQGPASEHRAKGVANSVIAHKIAALFAAAQSEAKEWDMKEVQIWNPTTLTLAATRLLDPKATVDHREKESITSLQWYGEGSWKDVDWICNEKYGWC